VLSDGSLGFRQARKIEDVPFPFPYAQMVELLLIIFCVSFPLIAAAKMGREADGWTGSWMPPLLTFLTNLAYFGLHKMARELEDPFVHPPNDLPSLMMQTAFNSRLLTSWDALRSAKDETLTAEMVESLDASPFGSAYYLWAAWERRLKLCERSDAVLTSSGPSKTLDGDGHSWVALADASSTPPSPQKPTTQLRKPQGPKRGRTLSVIDLSPSSLVAVEM